MQPRTFIRALVIALGLLTLAACGDDTLDQDTTAPASREPGDSGSVSSPPLPPGQSAPGQPGQPAPIQIRRDLSNTTPVEPESITADPTNDRRLLVRFWGGVEPCFGADVRVVETASDVQVTVLGGAPPEGRDRACIALAKLYQDTVELESPLGSRTIVVAK